MSYFETPNIKLRESTVQIQSFIEERINSYIEILESKAAQLARIRPSPQFQEFEIHEFRDFLISSAQLIRSQGEILRDIPSGDVVTFQKFLLRFRVFISREGFIRAFEEYYKRRLNLNTLVENQLRYFKSRVEDTESRGIFKEYDQAVGR